MKNKKTILELFTAYLEDNYTEAELKLLLDYFDLDEGNDQLKDRIYMELQSSHVLDKRTEKLVEKVDRRLFGQLKKEQSHSAKSTKHLPLRWFSGAAAVFLLVGFLWFQFNSGKQVDRIVKDELYGYNNDILPGANKAQLTLSDGKKITLGDQSEILRELNGINIVGRNGRLIYKGDSTYKESSSAKLIMNTLTVPKAGTYQLILPDGTKAWINSSSELRFPISFNGNERRVYVKGEVFFEVAKDALKPFRVEVNKATIEALGTQFNIKAYEKDKVNATLIEGIIKVTSRSKSAILNPGTEAFITEDGMNVKAVDIERAVAWKDGYFYFKKDKIQTIMKDISLWYDVEVHYKGTIPDKLYSGSIDKTAKLSQTLEMVKEVSNARFEINGEQVVILFDQKLK